MLLINLSHIDFIRQVDIELVYGHDRKGAVLVGGEVGVRINSLNNNKHT